MKFMMVILLGAGLVGCYETAKGVDLDAGGDADADTDVDTDADSDGDTDTDVDTDFDPEGSICTPHVLGLIQLAGVCKQPGSECAGGFTDMADIEPSMPVVEFDCVDGFDCCIDENQCVVSAEHIGTIFSGAVTTCKKMGSCGGVFHFTLGCPADAPVCCVTPSNRL